ncbi:hypothetical protein BGZ75_009758 [Mortierella antarctica]|nr:hypothetical protein BGZ75_009758 [Mortierella antarctica]
MKVKKRSSTKREGKDKVHQTQRSLRMKSLPEEDAGLVYWEDFCTENDWPKMPTTANIRRYTEVFVNRKVNAINQEGHHGHSYDYFLGPVWRLKAQALSSIQHAAATKPVMTTQVSRAPNNNKLLNGYNIHADGASRVSTYSTVNSNDNNNNKRPIVIELDSDSVDLIEDIFQTSMAALAPPKPLRSRQRKLTPPLPPPPPASIVSPLRQETIPPVHAHCQTDSVYHTYGAPGSVSTTSDAGDMDDNYPQFKAREFDLGLTHLSDNFRTYSIRNDLGTTVLNNEFGREWKATGDKTLYASRRGVVIEYRRLVMNEGLSDTEAIESLENQRGTNAIVTLHNHILRTIPTPENSVYGRDEPEYPVNLLYLPDRWPRPPPTALTGFPLPVRQIISILNIWKEWEIGWKGNPSIKSLLGSGPDNERVYNDPKYLGNKAVKDHMEAITALENIRGALEPSTFCRSKGFRDFVKKKWEISTAVEKWWNCGLHVYKK